MGMYDHVRCEMRLPAKNDSVLRQQIYQTKDLDCLMSYYVIREDGRLVDENRRREIKPGAPERPPMLSREWSKWSDEWWELKVGPDIPLEFTGAVNFYTDAVEGKGGWVEFCAFVEGGHVIKIVPVELPKRFEKAA